MPHQSAPQDRLSAGCLGLATRRGKLVRLVNKRPVRQNTLSLVLGCALLGTTMVVPVSGHVSPGPIAEPIPSAGVSVEIVDVLRMPDTRLERDVTRCAHQQVEKDRSCTNYARINFLRLPPDGTDRWFVNDMRGFLYVVNGPDILTYLNMRTAFPRLIIGNSFNAGFISFAFHPKFAMQGTPGKGKFYTTHTESRSGMPVDFHAPDTTLTIQAEGVLTEWTVTNPAANLFSGTRRELLRVALYTPGHHAFGEINFNTFAQPGDADYGLLYVAFGDSGLVDPRRRRDQLGRRDSIYGTILRIDPLGRNAANGKYGIPAHNPFVSDTHAIGEIFADGFRNPHRFVWDASDGTMVGIDTGQNHVEEVNIIHAGNHYGWPYREGTFILGPEPADNHWAVFPLPSGDGYTYPVVQYDHSEGTAIAGGQLYTADRLPALHNTFVFGDIVNGRMFISDIAAMKNADDGNPHSTAPIRALRLVRAGQPVRLREDLIKSILNPDNLPRFNPNPYNRTDIRFAKDRYGELLITTKMDGYIRRLGPGAVDQTLQAEAAVRGGGVRVETNHNGHYGSGFVNFPHPPDTQGYIEWSNVDGGAGGEAILEIRHALVASTSRTVRLSVNGVEQLLTFAPTGNWSTWQLTPVHVTLHAGANNVVRLQANRQDSANIDELRVRFVTRGAL
jgi:hypothetical protein